MGPLNEVHKVVQKIVKKQNVSGAINLSNASLGSSISGCSFSSLLTPSQVWLKVFLNPIFGKCMVGWEEMTK